MRLEKAETPQALPRNNISDCRDGHVFQLQSEHRHRQGTLLGLPTGDTTTEVLPGKCVGSMLSGRSRSTRSRLLVPEKILRNCPVLTHGLDVLPCTVEQG